MVSNTGPSRRQLWGAAVSVYVFPFDSAQNLTGLQSGDTYDSTKAAANKAVLAAACAAGGYFRIPESGVYRVDTATYAALVSRPTIIIGPKTGTATLRSGPDTPVSASDMFRISSGGSLKLLGNLSIEGAPNVSYGVATNFSDTVYTIGIRSQTACAVEIGDGVSMSKWLSCVKIEQGGALRMHGSQIGGRVVSIFMDDAVPGSLVFDQCELALDSDNGQAVGQTHGIYCYNGTDMEIRRSIFKRAGRTGFGGYLLLCGFGGSGTPTRQRIISRCEFSGAQRHVYFGSNGSTLMENTVHDSSGDQYNVIHVTPAGAFEVKGSTFTGLASHTFDQYMMLDDQVAGASGTFTGCRATGQYIYVARRVVATTAIIRFNNCYLGTPWASGLTLGTDSGCGLLICENTDFGLAVGALVNNSPNARAMAINCTRAGANAFSGLL